MAMAKQLKQYLDSTGVNYELIAHDYSSTSQQAARKAHIPEQQTAKAVVLEDGDGYMLAVIPASQQLSLEKVRDRCGRAVNLARESDLDDLFIDCASGAIPPVGGAYAMPMVWDDSLGECNDVFFEAGDHTDLVHVSGKDFCRLMGNADHGQIAGAA